MRAQTRALHEVTEQIYAKLKINQQKNGSPETLNEPDDTILDEDADHEHQVN